MELIFKIFDQSGSTPKHQKIDSDRITIGRAFDNDLILTDPAVSPHHAVIVKNETGQLALYDLDSINGIYSDSKQKINGNVEFKSGNNFHFGKTSVRIYTPDHPVADAVTIQQKNHIIDLLGNPLVLISIILLVSIIHAMEQWLNMFAEFKWQEIINIQLIIFGSTLLAGIFWSVVGRIFKHETSFRKQITLVLVFIAVQFLLSKFFNFLLFNSLDYNLSLVIILVIEFILITTLLWFNLMLATNQSFRQRLSTSITISFILITLSLYSEINLDSEFSESANYVKVLIPPLFRVAGTVTEDEFISDISNVFNKLESD